MGALICCSGCQLFLEGGRRHRRRGSFGCVSTAFDNTTAFFAAQGVFRTPFRVQHALFLRAVRPATDTDFKCWHAVSSTFSTDRRCFNDDTNDHCWRKVLQRFYATCCSVDGWFVTSQLKHPNAIRKRRTAFGKMDGNADNARRKRV